MDHAKRVKRWPAEAEGLKWYFTPVAGELLAFTFFLFLILFGGVFLLPFGCWFCLDGFSVALARAFFYFLYLVSW